MSQTRRERDTRQMDHELPKDEENVASRRERRLPEPLDAAEFAVEKRVLWPLQDRLAFLGDGPSRGTVIGGGAFAIFVVVLAILTTSGGPAAAPAPTVSEAASREPLIAKTPEAKPQPEAAEAPRETLHGAAPVFSPPSTAAGKEGQKTGASKPEQGGEKPAAGEASSEGAAPAASGSASEAAEAPSPGSARISSDPAKPAAEGSDTKAAAGVGPGATAARATLAEGPPAGPEALAVAREFAKGFVVYETGGEASAFRQAFEAAATPELRKALLRRPPKQPAGVKVPRAKVLNVVAGPSQGGVYKVSVALLRVGVTSELRLDMERIKTAGETGGRGEWRVTNVLG